MDRALVLSFGEVGLVDDALQHRQVIARLEGQVAEVDENDQPSLRASVGYALLTVAWQAVGAVIIGCVHQLLLLVVCVSQVNGGIDVVTCTAVGQPIAALPVVAILVATQLCAHGGAVGQSEGLCHSPSGGNSHYNGSHRCHQCNRKNLFHCCCCCFVSVLILFLLLNGRCSSCHRVRCEFLSGWVRCEGHVRQGHGLRIWDCKFTLFIDKYRILSHSLIYFNAGKNLSP